MLLRKLASSSAPASHAARNATTPAGMLPLRPFSVQPSRLGYRGVVGLPPGSHTRARVRLCSLKLEERQRLEEEQRAASALQESSALGNGLEEQRPAEQTVDPVATQSGMEVFR